MLRVCLHFKKRHHLRRVRTNPFATHTDSSPNFNRIRKLGRLTVAFSISTLCLSQSESPLHQLYIVGGCTPGRVKDLFVYLTQYPHVKSHKSFTVKNAEDVAAQCRQQCAAPSSSVHNNQTTPFREQAKY